MFFDDVKPGAPDIMFQLQLETDADNHPQKVDLAAGIYRNGQGFYNEMEALKDAKQILAAANPDHNYQITTGNASYLANAANLVFTPQSPRLQAGQVASAQTISCTGSLHIAFMLLSHSVPGLAKKVYVGVPAWGNYLPMIRLAGLEPQTYAHYDEKTASVDWESVLTALRTAPKGSIFVLQACCHNPTGADFTEEQWRILADEMKKHGLFPLFDIVYHGLGKGIDKDMYGVRHFAEQGFDMLVCQSFSKNFGLYGERVGVLHAVCASSNAASAVHDQMRFLIRSEFSSSPAYGSRLVDLVLSDPARQSSWREELATIPQRLSQNRTKLFNLMTNVYKTPGDWSVLNKGKGLFCLLPLNTVQCNTLKQNYHIYLVPNGRITVSGLNEGNIDYVARAIDEVVRGPREEKMHKL